MSLFTGEKLKISIFGESHSEKIGVEIEGLPEGTAIDEKKLMSFLARRAPGQGPHTTARKEADIPRFTSGVENGCVHGGKVCAVIENTNRRSRDYDSIKNIPRPGHADFAAYAKFGEDFDIRGGGQFSGRMTACLCIAGGICKEILSARGIEICAHASEIAGVCDNRFNPVAPELSKVDTSAPIAVLSKSAGEQMMEKILSAKAAGDSVGGVIECAATGVPAGVGDALFGGIENKIAQLVFSIPAVKGVEFGAGFEAARMLGSENNDPFFIENGEIKTKTNNHGGALGGISSGLPIIFRAAVKPTPSIIKAQRSVNMKTMTETELKIEGRHDPCIVPRAVPCMEAVMAIALCDLIL